jgi:hypothetical protein
MSQLDIETILAGTTREEQVYLLIASVRCALKNNVIHRNRNGDELTSATDVLVALTEEGAVDMDISQRIENTTVEEVLTEMLAEVQTQNAEP